MSTQIPLQMQAIALDSFGGPEKLKLQTLPVPAIGPKDVLIRVEVAAVSEWDPFEREGGYSEMMGVEPQFPYILGSEGAGRVAAVGAEVTRFQPGDAVYAARFLNPSGGFYAEYAAVDADYVLPVPDTLNTAEAAVIGGVGMTALRGLEDTLNLKSDETVAILGAGGGIGHVAVQIARLIGSRVIAIASGEDGVALAKELGADEALEGHSADLGKSLRKFAPDGIDVALLTAGGPAAEQVLDAMRDGGRVAYPNGINPPPEPRENLKLDAYNGEPDPEMVKRFETYVTPGPFSGYVANVFPMSEVAAAHRMLEAHYLGKLALRIA